MKLGIVLAMIVDVIKRGEFCGVHANCSNMVLVVSAYADAHHFIFYYLEV